MSTDEYSPECKEWKMERVDYPIIIFANPASSLFLLFYVFVLSEFSVGAHITLLQLSNGRHCLIFRHDKVTGVQY